MKKILVIGDDKIMRETIGDILQEGNFTVLLTKNGVDGVKAACSEHIDMVITNVSGMAELLIIQTIKKMVPALPVISIANGSIVSSNIKTKPGPLPDGAIGEPIPFTMDNLIEAVTRIFATSSDI
ncbi:MAG: response regulator [Bacteroidales bacterium]